MAVSLGRTYCRSVAQLVEHRSPKPGVVGSSPIAPAILNFKYYDLFFKK